MIRAIILSALIATPAAASNCGERDVISAGLAAKYGESPQVIGLDFDGNLMEVWANPETGSWTVMLTSPQGLSCLGLVGEAFQTVDAKPAGDPA